MALIQKLQWKPKITAWSIVPTNGQLPNQQFLDQQRPQMIHVHAINNVLKQTMILNIRVQIGQ